MKHIIIAPDSFKGTISAIEACKIIKKAFGFHFSNPIITLPIADGGEGSCEAFLNAKQGSKIFTQTTGPNFNKVQSYYALLDDKTAIIEMAQSAGLNLAKTKDPSITTTLGVGEQILHAIKNGSKNIILCLGGSATNDAGCGLAVGLGAKFHDKSDRFFLPTGKNLNQIKSVDLSELKQNIKGVKITTMCDINNPLYGPKGAAFVFGAQKGADEDMIKMLDHNLMAFNDFCKKDFDIDLQNIAGSGAAGGMGGGMVAFLKSELKMGIDIVLENYHFDKLLQNASFVISGEGRIDSQSIDGKALSGIAKRCKKANVPLICLVGGFKGDLENFYDLGISAIFSTNKAPQTLENIDPKSNLYDSALNVAKILKMNVG